MTQNLRKLVEKAEHDIGYYRGPDISEAKDVLHAIISAAGLGGIADDEVTGLGIEDGMVEIATRYSVRGCEQTDSYAFPEFLLDAADPVAAARTWGLERRRMELVSKIDEAARHQAHYGKLLAEVDAELAATAAGERP